MFRRSHNWINTLTRGYFSYPGILTLPSAVSVWTDASVSEAEALRGEGKRCSLSARCRKNLLVAILGRKMPVGDGGRLQFNAGAFPRRSPTEFIENLRCRPGTTTLRKFGAGCDTVIGAIFINGKGDCELAETRLLMHDRLVVKAR